MTHNQNIADRLIINPQDREGNYRSDIFANASQRIAGTYLHGRLAMENEYDIFGVYDIMPSSVGIYPAKVVGYADYEPATFFLWKSKDFGIRGLVVLDSDKKAYMDAAKHYENRSEVI